MKCYWQFVKRNWQFLHQLATILGPDRKPYTIYRMIPQILTQIYRTGLVPTTQMCTYNFFSVSRNLMLAAIVKVRICSKQNGSERTSLCAPKVIEEVNFPKYLWDFCAREGL